MKCEDQCGSVRRTVSLRSVLVMIGAVALVLGAAKQGLVSRDLKRRGRPARSCFYLSFNFTNCKSTAINCSARRAETDEETLEVLPRGGEQTLRSVARADLMFRVPQEVKDFAYSPVARGEPARAPGTNRIRELPGLGWGRADGDLSQPYESLLRKVVLTHRSR